jgi:hypothetical protein
MFETIDNRRVRGMRSLSNILRKVTSLNERTDNSPIVSLFILLILKAYYVHRDATNTFELFNIMHTVRGHLLGV